MALGGTEVNQHQSKLVFGWTRQLVPTNAWNGGTGPISTPLGYMGDCPDPQIPDWLLVKSQLARKGIKNQSGHSGEPEEPHPARTLVLVVLEPLSCTKAAQQSPSAQHFQPDTCILPQSHFPVLQRDLEDPVCVPSQHLWLVGLQEI